jgi:hypothetical protein
LLKKEIMENGITYVTSFYNIGRSDDISSDRNKFKNYFPHLEKLLSLSINIVIYTTQDIKDQLKYTPRENLCFVITSDFTNKHMVKTIVDAFKKSGTKFVSENKLKDTPEYMCIMRGKADLLKEEIEINRFKSTHFGWIDAGLFGVAPQYELLEKIVPFDKVRIMFIQHCPIYVSVNPRFITSPQYKVAGGFYTGRADYLLRFVTKIIEKSNFMLETFKVYGMDQEFMISVYNEDDREKYYDPYFGDFENLLDSYYESKEPKKWVIENYYDEAKKHYDIVAMKKIARYMSKCYETFPIEKIYEINPQSLRSYDELRLLNNTITASDLTKSINLCKSFDEYFVLFDFWEHAGKQHYQLLAFFSLLYNNADIIDIGTHVGSSALALSYNPTNRIHTFDIADKITGTDFEKNSYRERQNITYYFENLFDASIRKKFERLIKNSKIIMVDADPHDGNTEIQFYRLLRDMKYKGIVIWDDVLFYNQYPGMCQFWQQTVENDYKFDLTSLGHFSGTGLVIFSEKTKTKFANKIRGALRYFRGETEENAENAENEENEKTEEVGEKTEASEVCEINEGKNEDDGACEINEVVNVSDKIKDVINENYIVETKSTFKYFKDLPATQKNVKTNLVLCICSQTKEVSSNYLNFIRKLKSEDVLNKINNNVNVEIVELSVVEYLKTKYGFNIFNVIFSLPISDKQQPIVNWENLVNTAENFYLKASKKGLYCYDPEIFDLTQPFLMRETYKNKKMLLRYNEKEGERGVIINSSEKIENGPDQSVSSEKIENGPDQSVSGDYLYNEDNIESSSPSRESSSPSRESSSPSDESSSPLRESSSPSRGLTYLYKFPNCKSIRFPNTIKWENLIFCQDTSDDQVMAYNNSLNKDSFIFNFENIKNPDWTLVTAFFDLNKLSDSNSANRSKQYYMENAISTLSLPNNLVIYCDEENYDTIKNIRSNYDTDLLYTKFIVQNFEDFPLNSFREQIDQNRLINPSADQRNTTSYYLFCMSRYHMLKETVLENYFKSTHFGWINFCILRMGLLNVMELQNALELKRDKFSTVYIDYITKGEVEGNDDYFFIKRGKCSMCSGFFTGSAQYMTKVCKAIEIKFLKFMEMGYGHADEQLYSPVYFDNPEWFEQYFGDYFSMITNYRKCISKPNDVINSLINRSFSDNNHKLCLKASENSLNGYLEKYYELEPSQLINICKNLFASAYFTGNLSKTELPLSIFYEILKGNYGIQIYREFCTRAESVFKWIDLARFINPETKGKEIKVYENSFDFYPSEEFINILFLHEAPITIQSLITADPVLRPNNLKSTYR